MKLLINGMCILAFVLSSCYADMPSIVQPTIKNREAVRQPPCKACSILVESFKKGMERTARSKHDGGDAAWEEERLGSYKTSEVRLVEILESICNELPRGVDQCHDLAGEKDHLIEEWWFKHQIEFPDLYPWLCIEQMKVCCPHNTYGPNCDLCTNCNGNGKCKGNGTRKGNGKCACDTGYSGEFCSECAIRYYESFRDEDKLLCSSCHAACSTDGCTGGGPKKCASCKQGWHMQPDVGCFDINECLQTPNPCTKNQFCVNNEGSYTCLDCDKSCNGCSGDGPDLCDSCADGFELRDGKCADLTGEKRDQYVVFTRYLTYLGLCIAICVIFQSSTWIASIIGVTVAIYISASEYWLRTSPSSASPVLDTKELEDMIKNSF